MGPPLPGSSRELSGIGRNSSKGSGGIPGRWSDARKRLETDAIANVPAVEVYFGACSANDRAWNGEAALAAGAAGRHSVCPTAAAT